MQVAPTRLQHNFSKAASTYDARAEFQHVQTRRVLDAALMLLPETARVLDIGCGTGYFSYAAKQLRPHWQMIGLDRAHGMNEVASTRCSAITADAQALPIADASVDAVVSSLCYQWVEDSHVAFAELTRVLKNGGRAIIASLGPQTLKELRICASNAELPLGLLPMRALAEVSEALQSAGLEILMSEQRAVTQHYPSVHALLDSMRSIGAGNNFDASGRGLVSPKRWRAMLEEYEKMRVAQGVPATWEHQFFVLHKPR